MVVFLSSRLQNIFLDKKNAENVSAFDIESTWQLYLIFVQFLHYNCVCVYCHK